MLRAATRNVLGHKLRLALTALSIVLGVAFVSGTFILTDAMKSTFNALADSGNSDVYVRGIEDKTAAVTDQTGESRTTIPLTLENQIKAVPGVGAVEPTLQGSAIVIGKNGKAAVNGGAPPLGFGWSDDPKSWRLVSGRAPTSSSEVVLERDTLKLAKLKVGDQTRVVVGGTILPVTIVGSVRTSNDAGLLGATATLFDRSTALQLYAEDGKVPSFGVTAASGVSPDQLKASLAAAMPKSTQVLTGKQLADETKKNLDNGILKIFTTFFLVFALIAVFVGAFVILNTFSMLVAQRTRELALLRALGASRRQVTRSVLVEAFIVGAVSSAVGLGVGALIASALKALLGTFGLKIQGGLPIEARTVVWCFAVGILVTLVAAYFPARRAARIPPVAAMRDDVALPARSLRRRLIIGLLLTVAGVAVLILGLSGSTSSSGQLTGLGAGMTVLGVTVLAPIIAPAVLRVIGWPIAKLWGTTGRLARDNAIRNPRRSAATASALMIGLALVTGVTVLAQSTKASFSKAFNTDLTAEYALTAASGQPVPAEAAAKARQVPGVSKVAEYTGLPVNVNGEQMDATMAVGSDLVAAQKIDMAAGTAATLDQNQILVSSKLAKSKHWSVGQTLSGRVAAEPVQLTIGGIYTNDQLLGGLVMPRAWYEKAVPANQRIDFAIAVVTSDGKTSDSVKAGLEQAMKPYAIVDVATKSEYIKDQQGQLNVLLYILYALLGLAVVIAIFGIVNTLALSVFERTREIGLLRAVGMVRSQLRRVVRLESVAISLFGAVMGLVLGLFFGIAVQQALKDDGLDVLSIPYGSLLFFLVFAALAGVFAAIWPARRAAKLDVLRAITTE
jgi:putative ABC transport system permease protein